MNADALIQPVQGSSLEGPYDSAAGMIRVVGRLPRVRGFRVFERLAEDATATTYHAAEEVTGREVALRLLKDPLDPRRRERLLREARAAAAVRHDHVVRVINCGEADQRPWVTFELVRGGTLAQLLDLRGRLGWREAARLGAQVARGLAAIHAAGFVHRDVSPASVLRADRGQVKLGDLGLVRSLLPTPGVAPGLTPDGALVGTPAYMAPEAAASSAVGPAADLYSLGATLHHLIAGRPPFTGADDDVVRQHLHAPPPPLSSLVSDVPPALEGLVQRLMLKRPEMRPSSAAEVADVLEVIASTRPDEAWPRPRRVNVPAFAALAILVAMSAVGHSVFEEAIFGAKIPNGASATISAPAETSAPVVVSLTTPETVRVRVAFSRPGERDVVTLAQVMDQGQSTAVASLPDRDGDYTVKVLINDHVAAQQPVKVDRTPPSIAVAVAAVAQRNVFCLRASSDDPNARIEATRGWREDERFWVPLQDDFISSDALWREVDFTARDAAGNGRLLTLRLMRPPRLPLNMREAGWIPASGGRCLMQGYALKLPGGAGELEMVYVPPTGADEEDGFFIARHEVTRAQLALASVPPKLAPIASEAELPAVGLDHEQATHWCVDAGLRLPRSDEWLRAALRPLSLAPYPWGDEAPAPARCVWGPLTPDRPRALAPVGGRPAGASYFGCLDMVGNASEWCADGRAWGGSVASHALGLRALDPKGSTTWAGLRPVLGEPQTRPR